MKKLVCIAGGYHPYFTPNSKIAHNVLCELKKDYDITVIAQNNHFGLCNTEEIDGIKVVRVNDYNQMFHALFSDNEQSAKTNLGKGIFHTLLLIKKIINYAVRLCRYQSYSYSYTRKLIKVLNRINKESGIDILLPVSEPHETVIAAYKFRKKNPIIQLYPYQLDRFSEGNSLYENKIWRKLKYPRHKKTELKVLSACDSLFALPPIANYYLSTPIFTEYTSKIVKTEHPLLKEVKIDSAVNNSDNAVNFTYAGSLDVSLRNPEFVFRFLSEIDIEFTFHLYSFGNCQSIINRYKSVLGEKLQDWGKISSDLVPRTLIRTNILFTIGNNSDDEVPSKLFEYLSYGKPIVHFYYSDIDAYLKYLSNYKYALCIKMDCITDEKKLEFVDFCKRYSNVNVDFEDVRKQYIECTPQYVANLFHDVMKQQDFSHSVIVAHPNQQHSMELATALKNVGLLHSYVTTLYYKDDSKIIRIATRFFGDKIRMKMSRKGKEELDSDSKIFCKYLAYISYASEKISYRLYCSLYILLTKRFGRKLAKYAIKQHAKAVVLYDYTAVDCFKILAEKSPDIVRIIDMSSIPAANIDQIITTEESRGYGKYFENKRMRYTKEYCQYFSEEMELADAFLSPSGYVDRNIQSCGVKSDRIYRAGYGVNLEEFVYSQKNVAENEMVNFVFAGRIEGPKGIFYLLDAFDKLYAERKDFSVHIAGVNCIEDDVFYGKPYITYYGWVNKAKLIEIYKSVHVFVLPSLWEGLSLSVFEAMSSGLCQIVSDATGCDDIVRNSNSGFVIQTQDSQALYESALWFLEHKSSISKMSQNARNAVGNMAWENYYNQAAEGIKMILAKNKTDV